MELPVKSATYAMKGKQLLQQYGIRSYVGKRSDETGCYYYLNVTERDLDHARHILEQDDILRG